ncbi:MAG TPA: hypothetical protein VF773_13740 [Verrucomicrobiae bacterium]
MFALISASDLLNWGPIAMFVLAVVQTFCGISLVVASDGKRGLLFAGKTVIYGGFALGVLLFAKTLEAGSNILVPELAPGTAVKGVPLAFTLPFISYLFPALMAPFCYKGIFPDSWEKYVEIMSRSRKN